MNVDVLLCRMRGWYFDVGCSGRVFFGGGGDEVGVSRVGAGVAIS